jgi:hypothetical protein
MDAKSEGFDVGADGEEFGLIVAICNEQRLRTTCIRWYGAVESLLVKICKTNVTGTHVGSAML